MKILHLIYDHQVIERTLCVYEEVFPGCNEVLVFHEEGKPFRRLIKDYTGRIVNYHNLKEVALNYDFSSITHIIAHFMSMDKIDFIKFVPNRIHVCWEIYGYDLYDQFLEPRGYKIYYSNPLKYEKYGFWRVRCIFLFSLLATIKGYKYRFAFQKNKQFRYISNRINSIQYCCGYDAEYVKDFSKRYIPSYEIFNYSLSEVLGDLKGSDFSNGDDILIGNSASFSNNHLYILNYLKQVSISPVSKLIMPLSYGGNKDYINDVERSYNEVFPGKIVALHDYMPLHEYNNLFLRQKTMILSAWRQESQGTAMMGFYLGIKVYMSERSPLYRWFLDCGFIVYLLENITTEDLAKPLSIEEKKHNRKLVVERYNEDRIRQIFKTNIQ